MCGIFGHISLDKRKQFNFSMFSTLGINNDSRGGDSCGIFIDGNSEYGTTKDNKFFSDFFLDSELLKKTEEFNIALGHCRKASPGMGVSPEKAQPIVLRTAKSGETRFVMIHNGTITNYEDLAKKYIPDIDIKGLTDSQVMARIFYFKGYDCLSEYIGGSVFFIVDYRQPEPDVLMFKGKSRTYDYKNSVVTEERPLYISLGEDDLVFSSIDDYLPAFRPEIEVQTISENKLIRYKNGKLTVVKEYDRSNAYQKGYTTTKSSYGGWKGGTYVSGDYTYTGKIKSWISFEESKNTYRVNGNPVHGQRFVKQYGECCPNKESSNEELWFFYGILLKDKSCFKFLEDYNKRTKETPEEFLKKHQNLIRYLSVDQLYFKNGVLVISLNPYTYQVFSGELINYFSSSRKIYDNGTYKSVRYLYEYNNNTNSNFELLKKIKTIDVTKLRKKLLC